MEELPSRISSAISLALSPSPSVPQSQRHEAHLFLSQVKEAHQQTWQTCLGLFLEEGSESGEGSSKRWGAETRMFGVQVVGESLSSLAPEALLFVQSSLYNYFAREFVSGNGENGLAYLKNASLHLATQLFLYIYPTHCPQFFSSIISLLRQYPTSISNASSSSQPLELNYQTTDLLLRLLHEISLEISDVQLRLNKSTLRLTRDGELRDSIRENDAVSISSMVWEILAEALDGVGKVEQSNGVNGGIKVGLKGKYAREVAEMAVQVVGDYVSWIDINLMVTPTSIPLLLRALHLPSLLDLRIRTATADALIETVSKGMPASDKLALISVLDIAAVLTRLVGFGRENGSNEEGSEEVEKFRVKLGSLLNAVGNELCKLVEEPTTAPEHKATATAVTTTLLPLLVRLLADTNDETSSSVIPFANAVLSAYKKDKKRALGDGSSAMTPERSAFLAELLKVTVQKMEYKEDADWSMSIEGEEDEEMLQFIEMRRNLRTIGDAIAWIDLELYADTTRTIVISTIDAFESGGSSAAGLSWQRLELAMLLLYGFGQAAQANGPGAFVQVPIAEIQRAKRETEYRITYTAYPLSQLGEMMLRACRAKIVTYPHAAVTLQFFEIVVRYHDFFKLCPEYISEILPSFLDEHGMHQPEEAVQARVFYLFSRFVHQAKAIVQSQMSGEVISNILGRIQDLLTVKAVFPANEPFTDGALTKAAGIVTFFDSQLYLFEAVGTLISILNQVPEQQVTLLSAVLTPLLSRLHANVRTSLNTEEDCTTVLSAHHLIMAIGSVSKGFPDLSARSPVAIGQWVTVFKQATESVLAIAKSMGAFVVIRDAARFAFNRIVATTGQAVLPLIPALIDCLIGQITFPELADLLAFLGLLVAKYKVAFLPILDTLLMPVFNRIFHFLKLPITGTDDTVQHSVLRRAYFSFILSILSANLQEVFYSEKNKAHLQDILTSIPHYISHDSLAPDQRFGFIVLNKFLSLWVEVYRPSTAPPLAVLLPPSPVPGFEQFLYRSVVQVCFEVPLKKDFDYGDAQSFQVIGEISNFLKALLQKRGVEFTEFMTSTLLPSIQCPPEAAAAFMTALTEAPDGKQFKKYASEWLRSSRGPVV